MSATVQGMVIFWKRWRFLICASVMPTQSSLSSSASRGLTLPCLLLMSHLTMMITPRTNMAIATALGIASGARRPLPAFIKDFVPIVVQ